MEPSERLDEIVRELGSLSARFDAASGEERARIAEQQEALRAEAASLRDVIAPRSESEKRDELRRLEARLDDLYRDRIDVIGQAGGGSSGGDFGLAADAAQLNRHIDAASGKADIEARIRLLKAELEDA